MQFNEDNILFLQNFLNSHKPVSIVRLAKQSNYVLLKKGDQVQFCPSTMVSSCLINYC